MNDPKLYYVTLKLKSGAQWVEDVWAEYMDQAAERAIRAAEGMGQKVDRVLKAEVSA